MEAANNSLTWSAEYEFQGKVIRAHAPADAGLYEILQSREYPRYKGRTKTLKVGMSKKNLQRELLNHLNQHTAANRLARIRRLSDLSDLKVTFRFALHPAGNTLSMEKQMLRDFEDTHWDLPILNSTRGYERGADQFRL
jgi:hypothetical protein